MKKFKAKNEKEKLLSEQQFKEVFMEYLKLMDEFDVFTRNNMAQMASIRYHVDVGLEEHPELCKRLYRQYEAEKQEKEAENNQSNQNLGKLG